MDPAGPECLRREVVEIQKITLARVETTSMLRAGMRRAGALRTPERASQLSAKGESPEALTK